jgi:DNA repair protein RadC
VREPITVPEGVAGGVRIREPEDVVGLLRPRAAVEEVEVFWVLTLNSQSAVRGLTEVTRGLLNSSLVHPREVFRVAIVDGAAGIIVAHNHPSGDPTPSAEDRAITRRLVEAGRLLDVPVYDHVIIAGDRFVSLATLGLL